ncbi:hypothetical protein LX86_006459 [Lentzea aerocolonigenes]|nr:hypothetical protein [Lentzea aerocolonigenes]
MTRSFRPSMTERSIGRTLRKWRDDAEMSLAQACKKAGFSVATLSMTENALKPFDPLDIMILGRVYELPNETWKQLVRRAEFAVRERAQIRSKQSTLDLNAPQDVDESYLEATTICTFGADLIPRLIQTPEYSISAAGLGCPTYPYDDPARKAELYADWIKGIATSEASSMAVNIVVTKRAIQRLVGSPAITNAALIQLVHLSELDHFTVQVLDDKTRPDVQLSTSYVHLAFPHAQHDDVVYVETAGSGRYIEDLAACELVRQGFTALQGCALDPIKSVEEIAEAASAFTSRSSRRSPSKKSRTHESR